MKYKEGMSGVECLVAMSQGNPGAIQVLTKLLDAPAGDSTWGIDDVMRLDQRGTYGSDIWVMYKDQCGQDIEAMRAVLRG